MRFTVEYAAMKLIYAPRPFLREDRQRAIRDLLENVVPDRDFYILVIGAIVLAACGILTDSIPVLIASMIVAPWRARFLPLVSAFSQAIAG